MNTLPIYEALLSEEDDGLVCMSLVTDPATEVNWLSFSKDEQQTQKFQVSDEVEHCLMGVVMLADTPIYRRDGGYEYYITYSKQTLKDMAEKMLKDNTFNTIDLQHNGKHLDDGIVCLRELFVKDVEKGIDPKGFEDIADGSLLCTYKINNEELWKECTEGAFHGFSLEGLFTVQKLENNNKQDNQKSLMNKIKEMLAKMLMEFAEIETDKGTLIIEGELAVGAKVTEGEDGTYEADGKTITVKDGIVESIEEKEAEEETVEEETTEEEVEAEEEVVEETEEETVEEVVEETPNEVEELKAELEALKTEIEAIKNQLAEIVSTPSAEPIAEEFSKVVSTPKDINLGVFASLKK